MIVLFGVITNRVPTGTGWTKDRNPAGNTFWLCASADATGFGSWRAVAQDSFFQVINSVGKSLLLFVHGFNDAPEKALGTLQAIAAGLGDEFLPIAYLWNSDGSVLDYEGDRARANGSAADLLAALEAFKKVNVLAHSMGNYLLQLALQRAWTASADHLVASFASLAADVDFNVLVEPSGQGLAKLVDRGLILYSHVDGALMASTELHAGLVDGLPRMGLIGPFGMPAPYGKVDYTGLIHVNPLELWKNHGAAFESPKVYQLLRSLFTRQAQTVGV